MRLSPICYTSVSVRRTYPLSPDQSGPVLVTIANVPQTGKGGMMPDGEIGKLVKAVDIKLPR